MGKLANAGKTVDLFAAYTSPLPAQIIGELLGVPKQRWGWLQNMAVEITKILDPIRGFKPADMEATIGEMRGYILALADVRRSAPGDDLISALVEVEHDGDRLSENELVSLVAVLLFAGTETTTGLMGNAVVNLGRYPEQRALLLANPDLWPNAIEELLRYDPPITFTPRTAVRDTRVGTAHIRAGQSVELLIGAANRDPRRHTEPDQLRVARENPNPLSFGHGVHYCIGAALARATARVGLQGFIETFSEYSVDPDSVEWRTSATLRGPTTLPVRLTSV